MNFQFYSMPRFRCSFSNSRCPYKKRRYNKRLRFVRYNYLKNINKSLTFRVKALYTKDIRSKRQRYIFQLVVYIRYTTDFCCLFHTARYLQIYVFNSHLNFCFVAFCHYARQWQHNFRHVNDNFFPQEIYKIFKSGISKESICVLHFISAAAKDLFFV